MWRAVQRRWSSSNTSGPSSSCSTSTCRRWTALAVLRHIRGDPRLAGLPVVVFSAATEKDLRAAVTRGGADDYLRKGSCSLEDIRCRVRQWEEVDRPPLATEMS